MYKIKRFSKIEEVREFSLSDARTRMKSKKFTLFNHIILYMLLEDCLLDSLGWHWHKEIVEYLNQCIEKYSEKELKNNFNFMELFDGFINETEKSKYESELKAKIDEENNKSDAYRKIIYPSDFINSRILINILTNLANNWNAWVKKYGRKPKLTRNNNYQDSDAIIEIVTDQKYKYSTELNKYINKYIKEV